MVDGQRHDERTARYDPGEVEETVALVDQVDGKVRDRLTVPRGVSEEVARQQALGSGKVEPYLGSKTVSKTVWVPDKVIYVVVG